MKCCANCKVTNKDTNKEFLRTAYGYYLCEDCWDDYICSDEGRLEYLIGICKGDYSASDFDADFLCDVARSWWLNFQKLNFTNEQRLELEIKAQELGIL